jgi:hypothetical protein
LGSHLPTYSCCVHYDRSSCSKPGNSTAAIATPAKTGRFSALAPVGTARTQKKRVVRPTETLRKDLGSLWREADSWDALSTEVSGKQRSEKYVYEILHSPARVGAEEACHAPRLGCPADAILRPAALCFRCYVAGAGYGIPPTELEVGE